MRFKPLFISTAALLATTALALAAGNWSTLPVVGSASFCASFVTTFTGQSCGQTVPAGPGVLTGLELVPADSGQPGGSQPATVTVPSALLANMSGTPRNYIDNGSLNVQQRGTGIVTCAAAAAITSAAYGPDRFGCSTNVTSGAGRQSLVTTAALLPAGFANANELYRTSGALTQPVCVHQEIPTTEATALAGKTVTLSYYAAALAGLAADTNNTITASIYTGTGSDQGYGTMTASPAITPAWTGIAFVTGASQAPQAITTTPTRYSVTGTIPAAATEAGIALCFTPTATGAGTTDGFAYTGVQLEVAPSPTAYEVHSYSYDLLRAQRFFYRVTETATVAQRGSCTNLTSSISNCIIPFPVVMRAVPTMTYATGFAIAVAAQTSFSSCSANATSTTATSVPSTQAVLMSCATSAAGGALGTSTTWGDNSGTGTITASADF